MKKILGKLMGGVLLFSLSMSLTSCEGALDDILGEWSRPVPGSSTGGAGTMASIDLDADEMKLTVGDKGQLTAKVDPAGTAVTWSCDKEEVATVDANGLVTAVAMGTAIITAKAGDKMATCEVTVLPTLSTPLTVEAITAGTITVTNPKSGMKYSLNGGAKMAVTATPIDVAVGDKVEFYGNGTSITAYYSEDSNDTNDTYISGGLAQVKVYGNIMSLVDETDFATNYNTLPADYTFAYLFNGNKKLTDASGLLLPAMTLTGHCYRSMFRDCTSLTTTPKELPATTLADACYASMFYDCASLTTLPEKLLPATEMKQSCYSNMFYQCTGLTTVSEKLLPAEKLAHGCYQEMFERCTSLTTAPALPATNLANFCYIEMFLGCTSLTTAPKLPATTLKNACYSGMFVNCTGLTTAPELPAPTLAVNCYYQMFKGCTSLTTAYVKAAYTTTGDACEIMFNGCTAAGTLHTTSANQADWNGVMGSGKTWSTWTTAADWTD